ncbi:Uncharacterised protein [Candidatus Ornithobacterium hominis]|uniref:hypothetical protein n=1 Tax=Candidatus Ornithobacterium hominis TaxID=2497989 RepID=UPI000E5BE6A4|nr:hypothetical protein [Candidatus Ornithobacterium hominis]SZD73865.1 Uncharacterised protein [Candidatus Ornithobacterium hominis]
MLNKSHIDGHGNVVIQDADNSTITINLSDTEQVRKFFIDFQNKLFELPREILAELQKHNNLESEMKVGANIYLTVIAAFADFGNNAVLWGVTITNLSKEHRYFNQPYFKVSPKFELEPGLEHDTFMMFPKEQLKFPVRLEYGEVLSLTFEVNPNQFALFQKNATDDAFLTCYCGTTVGELYNSNEYKLDKFVKDYEAIKKVRR